MTPAETFAVLDAAAWRWKREHQRDAWLAWHTAMLARTKKMPSLKRLLGGGETKVLEGEELERRRAEKQAFQEAFDVEVINAAMQKGKRGR